MRSARWSDLARFFAADGWHEVRRTGDIRYEKDLGDGEVLRSKRPSGKTDEAIGPDLFHEILRVQLRVSAGAFWTCVESGRPAARPSSPLPDPLPTLPAWLAAALEREVGLRVADLIGMSESDARRTLEEHRTRPR